MKSINLLTRGLILLTLVLVVASCGKQSNQFMRDINVQSYYQDSDIYLAVDAQMDFGAMSLPAVNLPVNHPRTGENLGALELGVLAGGKNFIKLSFNLSAVTSLQASMAQLPNGASLPLIYANQVVEIPIGGSAGIKLYLSFVDGAQAIGIAVPIKPFDVVGQSVGTTSLFPIFNIQNIVGSAGLFTSKNAGQNGFGVFVDLTNVLSDIIKRDLAATTSHQDVSARMTKRMISASGYSIASGELNYSTIDVTNSQKKKIDRELYRLHKRKTKLKLK